MTSVSCHAESASYQAAWASARAWLDVGASDHVVMAEVRDSVEARAASRWMLMTSVHASVSMPCRAVRASSE